jgi:hypothetical protein
MPGHIGSETPTQPVIALLRRSGETVIPREIFRPGSLRADCERLSRPAEPMTDADVLSFLLKYFHASLYPGSEDHAVPLAEASDLLGRFYDLWMAGGAHDLPLAGDHSAYPLRMLADLPRTAHIFRSVANRALLPSQAPRPYLGLDCGTGSGILLTAAWFQAKRNSIENIRLFGVEYDSEVAERTRLLLASLGLGQIIVNDARDPAVYASLPEGAMAFVGNENVPSPASRLTAEPFSTIHAAVFSVMSKRLRQTIFFPEALVVRDTHVEIDVVLSKNNRFQPPRQYRSLRLRPWSIVIEGRLTRLRQVGKEFRNYLPEDWLRVMPGRW